MARLSGQAAASPSRDLGRVKVRPVGFRGLPTPETPPAPSERRDVANREQLACRIRAEFHEMPGLRLTLTQAARLFGLSEDVCARIMSAMVVEGYLQWTTDGRYSRSATGA